MARGISLCAANIRSCSTFSSEKKHCLQFINLHNEIGKLSFEKPAFLYNTYIHSILRFTVLILILLTHKLWLIYEDFHGWKFIIVISDRISYFSEKITSTLPKSHYNFTSQKKIMRPRFFLSFTHAFRKLHKLSHLVIFQYRRLRHVIIMQAAMSYSSKFTAHTYWHQ